MRFIHIADLHIGRKLAGFSLYEDQKSALDFIVSKSRELLPDAIFISGDVYDRQAPSAEAVELFDGFLTALSRESEIFIIGGNHDSQPRLSFGSAMLSRSGVHIARPYSGRLERFELRGECGAVDVWLMPHIKPREVERFFENADFETDEDAVRAIIERENIDPARGNVLLAHLFARARGALPTQSDSEINPIGGLSEVDISVFDAFNYVALGHLHAPQKIGRESARYAGSPLKYSFSELRHVKSFVCGEMLPDGSVGISLVPIPAIRGMREIKGPLEALVSNADESGRNDFIRAILTDDVPPLAPMERLAEAYPNVVTLEMSSARAEAELPPRGEDKSPMELFADFYKLQTGVEMTEEMLALAVEAFEAARKAASE